MQESDIPRWVWEGLYTKWSNIDSPDSGYLCDECSMCQHIHFDLYAGCQECPLHENYCGRDSTNSVTHPYTNFRYTNVPDWYDNLISFREYILYYMVRARKETMVLYHIAKL